MTSRVDIPRAREMREQGMTLKAIGDEFGVTRERIRQLVGSPLRRGRCVVCGTEVESTWANAQFCSRACGSQHWHDQHRRECIDCGAAISYRSKRCVDCRLAFYDRERLERWTLIAKLWNEGLAFKAMALQLGTTPGSLGVVMARMKHAGWDLKPRRAGWSGHSTQCGVAATEDPPKTRDESRRRMRQAVVTGRLDRPGACERCGREGYVDGHHHDYSKPLDVEWLCRSCHIAHHTAERQAA